MTSSLHITPDERMTRRLSSRQRPVAFTRRRPEDLAGDTVIPTDKAKPPVTHSTEI